MFKPKVVLITGATGDFGKAFVERFDALGCHLIVHGRSQDKLNALMETIQSPVHGICFDVTDAAAMTLAIENLPADFRDIDVLVNNAGGAFGLDKIQDSTLSDLETMIEINSTALVRMTHAVLPGMAARKRGHIINIGSIAGNHPYPGGHVYCAVKAFVKQFSMAIRSDLGGTNVRVTNIEPGQAETQFSTVRFKGNEDKAAAVYAGTQSLQPEDVAETVFWSATLPEHVNINRIEVLPTCQSFAGLAVHRD